VLRRAIEAGVQLIDTADAYGPAVAEEMIFEALHPYPPDLVIATKGGVIRRGPFTWVPNGRPEYLRSACDASLSRLGLEAIDLYQLHTLDANVPLEESIGALAELRNEGKIRHVGMSNVHVDQIERARMIVPIASVQNRLNLLDRTDPVVGYCDRDGIPYLPWFPLGRGDLARSNRQVNGVARKHGATPAQVALAWLLAQSAWIVAIPGTTSPSHLEENVRALELQLDSDDLAALRNIKLEGSAQLRHLSRNAARTTLHSAKHAAGRIHRVIGRAAAVKSRR
jgi:aryl-alcohol dehydrogenase-like predicted oxidoreductase